MKNKNACVLFFITASFICQSNLYAEDCVAASKLVRQGAEKGDGSEAEQKFYNDALAACPGLPEAHYNLGVLLAKRGDRDAALASFMKAREAREDALFFVATGNMKVELGKLDDARADYERAIEIDSKNVKGYQGLAAIYEKKGETERSLETLEKARNLDKENPLTLYSLAVLKDRAGDMTSALTIAEKLVEVDESNFEAHRLLGSLYEKAARLEDSAREFSRAVKLNPESSVAQRSLGMIYHSLGDLDKAEMALRKAVNLDAADMVATTNLAVVLVNRKQPALAEEMLSRLVSAGTKDGRVFYVLGRAQIDLGRLREAETSLLKSIELDGNNGAAHNNLGVLYQRLGKGEQAKREFEIAMSLSPDLATVKSNLENSSK